MTTVPFILEGSQREVAFAAADLQAIRSMDFPRKREVMIAQSYLLNGLGEILCDYEEHSHIGKVYVAQRDNRVVTLCFRRRGDSGTLQVAYDSKVDPS